MSEMTPREIVHELDSHIIGQQKAKRSVAIALRCCRSSSRSDAKEHSYDWSYWCR